MSPNYVQEFGLCTVKRQGFLVGIRAKSKKLLSSSVETFITQIYLCDFVPDLYQIQKQYIRKIIHLCNREKITENTRLRTSE